jgi:hypothetical protein
LKEEPLRRDTMLFKAEKEGSTALPRTSKALSSKLYVVNVELHVLPLV